MFRNQYDNDVTIWSPQGRIHQVEYAMEAVKLGTVTVGVKSSDYAVVVALCKTASELSDSQRKIIPIDYHVGVSISGITADARVLSSYLRTECLSYKHEYSTNYPVARLIYNLGKKMQVTTQSYDRRPYGVGLLVAGYDDYGPHIFQVMPSANYFNCKAMSIGARSQGARTYFERHLDQFNNCSKDELICHGIEAVRGSLPNNESASKIVISVGIVGKDQPFKIFNEEENKLYLDMAKEKYGPVEPMEVQSENDQQSSVDEEPRPSGMEQ